MVGFLAAATPGLVGLGNLTLQRTGLASPRMLEVEAQPISQPVAIQQVKPKVSPAAILKEYAAGRISSALELARDQDAALFSSLETFEIHYSAGLDARAAGDTREAIRHLTLCRELDLRLSNGQSKLSSVIRRQLEHLTGVPTLMVRAARRRLH